MSAAPGDRGRLRIARALTLVGWLTLVALLLNWFTWLDPPETVPRAFLIIALVLPLMLPLRGLLHGRRRAHQWICFIVLFHFAIGIDTAVARTGLTRDLGVAMIACSLVLFTGAVLVAKRLGPPRRRRVAPDRTAGAED